MAAPTPQQCWEAFCAGVAGVLNRWQAFRMAIDNGFGGVNSFEKEQQLLSGLLSYFAAGKEVYPDSLAKNLESFCFDTLHTEVDDGSIPEIAQTMFAMYVQCKAGDLSTAQKYINAPKASGQAMNATEEDDDNDEGVLTDIPAGSSETDVGVGADPQLLLQRQSAQGPVPQPDVDDDGFTTVQRKR